MVCGFANKLNSSLNLYSANNQWTKTTAEQKFYLVVAMTGAQSRWQTSKWREK